MNLNLNSWYVWLWDYTYEEDVPNNLCPFFWKLIAAMLLFIPNIILRIPVVIVNMFCNEYNKIERGDARTGIGALMYIIGIATILVCYTTYNWFLWSINSYSYDYAAANIGGMFLLVGLFLLIRYYWLENEVGYKVVKTANTNMLTTYTKAWYNNHCPKINWK